MSFINRRTDVSAWLIHFVRERVPETDFHFVTEDDDDSVYGGLEPDARAESVLKNIITIGGLLPGYSFREIRSRAGTTVKTTIYGGVPAVCFTEAPLQDFAQYVADRGTEKRCAPLGVCLLKREVFAAGGRPVIYGLAGDVAPRLIEDESHRRIIDPDQLPLPEQFRYVAYDPNRERPLDWTHEREWRWVPTDEEHHTVWMLGPEGIGPYPALPLFLGKRNGGFFSRVGLIAKTRGAADELAASLLRYLDAGGNDYDTTYDATVLANTFVVPLDEALASGAARVEDLQRQFRITATNTEPSAATIERVQVAVEKARAASLAVSRSHNASRDVAGGATVVTDEATSDVVRALLALGVATPVGGMYYSLNVVQHGGPVPQELNYHEAVAIAACQSLRDDLGDIFFVRTYWD